MSTVPGGGYRNYSRNHNQTIIMGDSKYATGGTNKTGLTAGNQEGITRHVVGEAKKKLDAEYNSTPVPPSVRARSHYDSLRDAARRINRAGGSASVF